MLIPTLLAQDLEGRWLPGDDGPFADSIDDSAAAFAAVVAGWYASAQAGPFPVATARARESQLRALAVAALSAQGAMPAGALLAIALMAYMAAQSFGPGVATPPAATSAAGAMIGQARGGPR